MLALDGLIYMLGGLDPFDSSIWTYDGMSDPGGKQRRNIGCSAGGLTCAEQLNVGGAAAGVVDDAIYLAGGLCNITGPDSQNCTCNASVGGCNGQNTDRDACIAGWSSPDWRHRPGPFHTSSGRPVHSSLMHK